MERYLVLSEDVGVLVVELAGCLLGVGVEDKFLKQDGVNFLFGIGGLLLVVDADDGGFVTHAETYFAQAVPRYTRLSLINSNITHTLYIQMNRSSFLNDSVISEPSCHCTHRAQYEETYAQLSHLRSQHRAAVQKQTETEVVLDGTRKEVAALREILASQKEMMLQMGHQNATMRQEMERLEMEAIERDKMHSSKLAQEREKMKVREDSVLKLKDEGERERERLRREVEGARVELQGTRKQLQQLQREKIQMQEQIKQHEYHSRGEKQMLIAITHELQIAQGQKTPKVTNSEPIALLQMCKSTIQQLKEKEIVYEQQLSNSKRELQSMQTKNAALQAQVNSSIELFEQQAVQMQQLRAKMRQTEQQQTKNQQNQQTRRASHVGKIMGRVMSMLRNGPLCNAPQTADRITTLMNEGKQFELEIALRQAEREANEHITKQANYGLAAKQCLRMQRTARQFGEDCQLLKMKLSTLQREHKQLLEDNHRLLRLNKLGKAGKENWQRQSNSSPYFQ